MCDVCCETFNYSNHKRVRCPYCPFKVCAMCTERYILESPDDPHCMSCRKGWNREILCDNFTVKFVTKTLKTRREELLFERERSLMPATQPLVEVEKKVRELRAKIAAAKDQMETHHKEQRGVALLTAAVVAVQYNLDSEILGRLKRCEIVNDFQKKIVALDVEARMYEQMIGIYQRDGAVDAERRQFVRACPHANCTGFLSTAWKCGLCENWTCPDCHEVKGLDKEAAHTCDPANVATAKLLARDSRPCPKCAAVIFKIDGCDQMFCTQCHTAFSWRKGTIETGRVHNPHYYEWMRAHGNLAREPGDIPCGGVPHWASIARVTADPIIATIHRIHNHIQFVTLQRYATNALEDNRDIRIRFMIRDFTEEVFKAKLQQREKARQKKVEIRQVLDMYQAVTTDLLQTLVQSKDVPAALTAFSQLRDHVNAEFAKISKRYTNCAVPYIQENFIVY